MDRLTIGYIGTYAVKGLCTIDRLGEADDYLLCDYMNADYCKEFNGGADSEDECEGCILQKCIERLGQYEDIGLTPEQLMEIDKLYAEKCKELVELQQRLEEYQSLEEQGKLLKLPCAVGDTVYCIYSRYTKCSAHNEEFEESSCMGCESECDSRKEYYVQEQRAYSLDWIVTQIVNKHFGKLVFLTREESEAALKELKDKKYGRV